MSEPDPRYPDDALCAQVGYTDLWYPEKGASTREAKAGRHDRRALTIRRRRRPEKGDDRS